MTDSQNCMTVNPHPKTVEDTFFGYTQSPTTDEVVVNESYKCEECGWEGKNKRALTAHKNFSHKSKKE